MPFSECTVAVTVTHNPQFDLLRSQLESLEKQCLTVLVDNHSEDDSLRPIRQYCDSSSHVTLIALDSNSGIANAQNTGIRHILENQIPGARTFLGRFRILIGASES